MCIFAGTRVPLGLFAKCCKLTGVFLLLGAMSPNIAATQGYFIPRWKTGAAWEVQALYPVQMLKVDLEEVPSYPIRWRFEVQEENTRTFILSVTSPDTEDRMLLTLERETLSLKRAELYIGGGGKEQTIVTEYSGVGMVPDMKILGQVPYQLPLFPIEEEGVTEYERISDLGEERLRTVVRQEVRRIDDVSEVFELMPEYASETAMVPEARYYYLVTSIENNDETIQIWAQDVPWFIYSRTDSSTSWMIR